MGHGNTYYPHKAFSFSCVNDVTRKPHGDTFPCMSQFDTSRNINVTRTDFIAGTITFGEVAQRTSLHLFALGVVYTTPVGAVSDPRIFDIVY
ncbi:hypothetical protein FE257_001819 [Aspergillus nanangensis]|uniref:Uncharacterized protein n=1 Tax=Aspergillus nanangensis TaxID=2582783 RepID=A0AAD4CDE1_ASPNN|nr:hypothetical protein FE257_001819 [Aspergillus nanangensis]